MSDSLTIVLVVLFMLLSPLLSVVVMVVVDRRQVKVARLDRLESLIKDMDEGKDFPYETDVTVPCPECGAEWVVSGQNPWGDTKWTMDHTEDSCLMVAAKCEQTRRYFAKQAEELITAAKQGQFTEDDNYW